MDEGFSSQADEEDDSDNDDHSSGDGQYSINTCDVKGAGHMMMLYSKESIKSDKKCFTRNLSLQAEER